MPKIINKSNARATEIIFVSLYGLNKGFVMTASLAPGGVEVVFVAATGIIVGVAVGISVGVGVTETSVGVDFGTAFVGTDKGTGVAVGTVEAAT